MKMLILIVMPIAIMQMPLKLCLIVKWPAV